jgi:N-acetylglucosamine-6-phosphate deacetylase
VLPITLQSQFIFLSNSCVYSFERWSRCLGIENKKGTLRPGAHADLVVLDKQGTVLSTWIRGKQTWLKSLRA